MIKFEDLVKPLTLKEFRSKFEKNRPFYTEPGLSEHYGKKKKIVSGMVSWFRLNYLFNAFSELRPNVTLMNTDYDKLDTKTLHDHYFAGTPIVVEDATMSSEEVTECLRLFEGFFERKCEASLILYPQNYETPVCVPSSRDSIFIVVSGTTKMTVYSTKYDMLKKESLTLEEEDQLIPAVEQECHIGSMVYVPSGLYHTIEPLTNSFVLQVSIMDCEPEERTHYDFYRNWKK